MSTPDAISRRRVCWTECGQPTEDFTCTISMYDWSFRHSSCRFELASKARVANCGEFCRRCVRAKEDIKAK